MVKQILGFTHQYRKEGLMCLWLGPTYPIVFLFKPELAEVNCFCICFCQQKSELGLPVVTVDPHYMEHVRQKMV